jgi:hypothetical protein
MMGRCYRVNDSSFKRYNKLGIKVCSSWIKDIEVFRQWFKEQITILGKTEDDVVQFPRQFTLDRIDSLAHYTPDNCRIANMQTQGRNHSNRNKIKIISAEGEEIEV